MSRPHLLRDQGVGIAFISGERTETKGVFTFQSIELEDFSQLVEVIDSSLRLLENGPRCWFHSPAFTNEAMDERRHTFPKSEIFMIFLCDGLRD